MEKKIDWVMTVFIILVIVLAFNIGQNTNERANNKEAYEQASYLVNNELDETKAKIAAKDSLIQRLNSVIELLEK
ncbi:hypothetical protein [Ekhidna sp.]|uniref:hypothetical protein n=1 Tax=Ekhidna sp. TaxID=2608089 RepID=UPI003C7BC33A